MTGLKRTLRSRRGFTLVELVVVLVIAGITASFAVPALTGYIDNAKEKQAVSETQACVETVTRIAAQKYALVQNASITGKSDGADALKSWAGMLTNEVPAVTGDVALTEGSGQYLLHVENAPNGSKTPDCLAGRRERYSAGDDLQRQRAGFVLGVHQRRWDTGRIHGYRNECACGRKY